METLTDEASEFLGSLVRLVKRDFPSCVVKRQDGTENFGLEFHSENKQSYPIFFNLSKCKKYMDIGVEPFFGLYEIEAEQALAHSIITAIGEGRLKVTRVHAGTRTLGYENELELKDGTKYYSNPRELLWPFVSPKERENVLLPTFKTEASLGRSKKGFL